MRNYNDEFQKLVAETREFVLQSLSYLCKTGTVKVLKSIDLSKVTYEMTVSAATDTITANGTWLARSFQYNDEMFYIRFSKVNSRDILLSILELPEDTLFQVSKSIQYYEVPTLNLVNLSPRKPDEMLKDFVELIEYLQMDVDGNWDNETIAKKYYRKLCKKYSYLNKNL